MYRKNHKVFCKKLDQTWAFISHKLGSEVVPAPVNVRNGILHESPKVSAVKWYKNGLHVLTVTTVVGFRVHQNMEKCREDKKITKCNCFESNWRMRRKGYYVSVTYQILSVDVA